MTISALQTAIDMGPVRCQVSWGPAGMSQFMMAFPAEQGQVQKGMMRTLILEMYKPLLQHNKPLLQQNRPLIQKTAHWCEALATTEY